MTKTISIDDLDSAIKEELTLYTESVNEEVREAVKVNMREMVKETKQQKFKQDTGDYRGAIASMPSVRTPSKLVMMWYVRAPHYRLSHLLEHGHLTSKGTRTIAYGFIGRAEEKAVEQFMKDVEEAVKNG